MDDGIATLTLNRPQVRNATLPATFEHLLTALTRLAVDPRVRLVVVTGAGDSFCAGADLKALSAATTPRGPVDDAGERAHGLRARMEAARLLHEMPKPTLAVIRGPAYGAGLSLALACDLRIAADDVRLCTGFAKVGLSGDYGGSYFLTHLVGPALARELYFTARVVDAEEALRIGLVNRVVPVARLGEGALAWAQELASAPTVALGFMKANLNVALEGTLAQTLDSEVGHIARCVGTDDHREAMAAAVEKRRPRFTGR
jgi:2-(1,2-epoxy-1,2-dihydrophenyl)acetyl-CoA isomerase